MPESQDEKAESGRPSFVRPIEVPGEVVDECPLNLTPEAQAGLDRQLRAIDEAHAAAMRRAHEVVIWR